VQGRGRLVAGRSSDRIQHEDLRHAHGAQALEDVRPRRRHDQEDRERDGHAHPCHEQHAPATPLSRWRQVQRTDRQVENRRGPGTMKIAGITTMPAKNGNAEPDALDEEGERHAARPGGEQDRPRKSSPGPPPTRSGWPPARVRGTCRALARGSRRCSHPSMRACCSVKMACSIDSVMPPSVCSSHPTRPSGRSPPRPSLPVGARRLVGCDRRDGGHAPTLQRPLPARRGARPPCRPAGRPRLRGREGGGRGAGEATTSRIPMIPATW